MKISVVWWLSIVPIVYLGAGARGALPRGGLFSGGVPGGGAPWGPGPPYSVGMSAASQPALVSSLTNFSGYSLFLSTSRQYASPKSAQSFRTAARICSRFGSVEKSIVRLAATAARDATPRHASAP